APVLVPFETRLDFRFPREHFAVCEVGTIRPEVNMNGSTWTIGSGGEVASIRKYSRISGRAGPIPQHVANNHLPNLIGVDALYGSSRSRQDIYIIFEREAGDPNTACDFGKCLVGAFFDPLHHIAHSTSTDAPRVRIKRGARRVCRRCVLVPD